MKNAGFIVLCFFTLLAGCQHIPKKKFSIDTLSATYRTEDSFKGIVEAFSKRESKGGRCILRTNEEQRAGFYLTVKFNHTLSLIPKHSKVRVSFITQHAPQEVTYEWEIPEVSHSLILQNELVLGITDHPQFSTSTKLIAWQVELLDPQGVVLATQKSFAW